MASGKASELRSARRSSRTVERKSEVAINLKAKGKEELQTQQAK